MTNELKLHHKNVYLALVKDMEAKKNGLFTFVMRMEAGYIIDYVVMENIQPTDIIEDVAHESEPSHVSN